MMAFIQAYKGFVVKVDRLGKEYELARVVKQNIFDTHPELSSP